mgnify:CR=1 FL=1
MMMNNLKNKIKKCNVFSTEEKALLIALIVTFQLFEMFSEDL